MPVTNHEGTSSLIAFLAAWTFVQMCALSLHNVSRKLILNVLTPSFRHLFIIDVEMSPKYIHT